MKKTFKFFDAALAIVAAASCAKEISNDNIQNGNPAEETVHMTFSASIDAEEDTKTALNGKVVEWKESDNIKLFKNDYYPSVSGICAVVAGTISQDKKFADFEGDLVPSTDYIAAYPADWYVDRYGTPYRIDFPGLAEQVAVENSFDSSKHLMIANSLSDDNHFQFKNVCALAKVTIGTDDVYSVIVEGKSQFSTYGDYGSIGGALGCKTNDLSWYAINSNQVHSITLKNEDGSALRKGATYYIVLPACTIKNFTLSVCDQNGNVLGSKSKASDFVVERNKIYDLGTLKVGVKYKKGNRMAKASDLQNNGSYIIEYLPDNANCSDLYWTEMNDGSINLSSVKNGNFTANHIFTAFKSYAGTDISGQTYANKSRATWKSMASGKFISGAFKAEFDSNSYALYTILANGWYRNYDYPNPQTGPDIDMYNGGDTTLKILYNGSNIVSNGGSCSKWHIYEAVIENTLL